MVISSIPHEGAPCQDDKGPTQCYYIYFYKCNIQFYGALSCITAVADALEGRSSRSSKNIWELRHMLRNHVLQLFCPEITAQANFFRLQPGWKTRQHQLHGEAHQGALHGRTQRQ